MSTLASQHASPIQQTLGAGCGVYPVLAGQEGLDWLIVKWREEHALLATPLPYTRQGPFLGEPERVRPPWEFMITVVGETSTLNPLGYLLLEARLHDAGQ